jgi:hypothetical protein
MIYISKKKSQVNSLHLVEIVFRFISISHWSNLNQKQNHNSQSSLIAFRDQLGTSFRGGKKIKLLFEVNLFVFFRNKT